MKNKQSLRSLDDFSDAMINVIRLDVRAILDCAAIVLSLLYFLLQGSILYVQPTHSKMSSPPKTLMARNTLKTIKHKKVSKYEQRTRVNVRVTNIYT